MRVVKVADVPVMAAAGMSGAMIANGEALGRFGHEVTYLWRHHLMSERCPLRLRRLVVPWAVCLRVVRLAGKVDLVEIHEPLAGPYAWLARTRLWSRHLPPCVVLSHGLEDRCWRTVVEHRAAAGTPVPWHARLVKRATLVSQARFGLRRAAQVLVLNQEDRSNLERSGIPVDRISVVANGVKVKSLPPARESALGLRVVFVGTWIERKGVKELAEAWLHVSRSHPSAFLTIVGTGTPPGVVRASFDQTCRRSISVFAHLEHAEVLQVLSRHDAFVLPSWYEGMPLAALEAAASGLAVIASAIPGTTDIFAAGEQDGAILVDPFCPGALAASIIRLADDYELLKALQGRAQATAARFTWKSSAAGFDEAYRKALRRVSPDPSCRSPGWRGGAPRRSATSPRLPGAR